MPNSKPDISGIVIDNLAQAVADGVKLLPKFPRRWLCKHGDIKLDSPNFPKNFPERKEIFKKLKAEYLEMLEEAQSQGIA